MSRKPTPVKGPLLTKPFLFLAALFLIGLAMMAYRLVFGLGPATGLNDGYPWGVWIAFDVVTGTALACGGYAVAILCYVFNKGKYHPLVRPAVLTSALGYTLAGLGIALDVGRYWWIWVIPVSPRWWNPGSALLEVALCVMSYIVVLWIELAPAFFEKWEAEGTGFLKKVAGTFHPILEKALPWLLALGLLLPTMHQSSLGSVMMISVTKLHKLWHTPLLPLLFLVSCVAMGYAIVVIESALSSTVFGRERETKILGSLSGVMVCVIFAYLAIRLADILLRGRIGLVFAFDRYSAFFLVEMALFLGAALLLLPPANRTNAAKQFRAAMCMILAGGLYRFDTYIIAWNPGDNFRYFPTAPELLVTLGIVSLEVMLYLVIVKKYPILAGAPAPRNA